MNLLMVKLYYHFASTAMEYKGQDGADAIACGLTSAGQHMARYLKEKADSMPLPFDLDYARANCPLYWNMEEDPYWQACGNSAVKELLAQAFYPAFRASLN